MVNLWRPGFCQVRTESTSILRSELHVPAALETQGFPHAGRWETLSLSEIFVYLTQMIELPSLDSIIFILQNNTENIQFEDAKRLHLLIYNFGLNTHHIIGNYLVQIFTACGSLPDAYQAFQKVAQVNEYSWTPLYQDISFQSNGLQQDTLPLSSHMLQELLKACSRSKSIDEGQELHFQVVKEGFETDPFVGSAMVDMYAKCGSLVEAREVFDNLAVRDVVLWTALIAGYAEHGLYVQALTDLEQMQLEGISPNAVTYLCILKGFGSARALKGGHKVHADIVSHGFEKDLYIGSTLVDLYAKCGFLLEAEAVFNGLSVRNEISWNARITAHADNKIGQEVLDLLDQMQLDGLSPDAVTFVCTLKGCGSAGDIERGQNIHFEIAKRGLERVVSVGNSLVDMYAKCGLLREAEEVFNSLPDQNVVSWTALITGYAECGFDEKALLCLDQMESRGLFKDAITFVGNLKAVSSHQDLRRGYNIHFEIIKEGFETDLFIGNSLVDFYAQSGLLLEARDVLVELPVRDVVSWNSMIAGLIEHGAAEEALSCLRDMQVDGLFPDAVTLMSGLKACACIGNIIRGQELHAEISRGGYDFDIYVGNSLIDMYVKCGLLAEACKVFDMLPVRDVASWTAQISGFADHGFGAEAWNCFEDMQLQGVSPNVATFMCCLKACGSTRAIRRGRVLHAKIIREGFDQYPSLGSSLVDMYAKCGFLIDARAIFEVLSFRDDVSYNALLWGYAERGHRVEMLKCMEQMRFEGVAPDSVTFGSILKVCGTSGAISFGQAIHCEIVKRGLESDAFVGDNLVDLYAKCGLHAEACSTCNGLPMRDVVSWNTLISGYVEHGIGEEALNCLEQMQLEGLLPDEITYVSCLKACGSIGCLDRGLKIYTSIVKEELEEDFFICNTLVDLYAKCGSLTEARALFDELPYRDVVSWNVLVAGYASQGEIGCVSDLLERMREDDLRPNATTVLGILTVSNHSGLISEGQRYFEFLNREHTFLLTIDHYNCMIDLLGRAGQFENVQGMLEQMPFQPNHVTWSSALSSCQKLGNVDLGIWAFNCAVCLSHREASMLVAVSNLYAANYT